MHLINANDGNLVVFGVVSLFGCCCSLLYTNGLVTIRFSFTISSSSKRQGEQIKQFMSFYLPFYDRLLSPILFMKLTFCFMMVLVLWQAEVFVVVAASFDFFKLFCKYSI